jgi:hypothetical protein
MIIEISLGSFYSRGDERRFFSGLRNISAIEEVRGIGRNLLLMVNLRRLSVEEARELLALLWRYGIPLSPLFPLSKKKRYQWLNDVRGYWYRCLFKDVRVNLGGDSQIG